MASFISPIRDNRVTHRPSGRSALRIPVGDDPHASRRDPVLIGTASFSGDSVYDAAGRFLGEIEELVLDLNSGRVAYTLLSAGGFLGVGRRLFAVPWGAITVDQACQRCILNADLQRLVDAPTIDGNILAQMANTRWAQKVHAYYGCRPNWE
jgi:PRC-barrel domain